MSVTGIKAKVLTGVPPYNQDLVCKENGKDVIAGCGPTAALMLLAYYDARFGYKRLVSSSSEKKKDLPDDLVINLRKKMHTINDAKNGQEWGMTLPAFFHSGLDSFITECYGKTVIKEFATSLLGHNLDDVFSKSCQLIDSGKPHVFLFDWEGSAGIFPNHYVVIVGYRCDNGKKHLIANAGWGDDYQFLTIDMEDKKVKPATLYYVESIEKAPEHKGDGHKIGPDTGYKWTGNGKDRKINLTVKKHFSSAEETWEVNDSITEIFEGTDFTICTWK